jgi:hypothetical protein
MFHGRQATRNAIPCATPVTVDLIIETVNAQTLASFAKDLNDNKGEELPSDLFKDC